MNRYRPALAVMAFGYLLAFLVWAVKHFLLTDSGDSIAGIANALMWIAAAVATIGALWFVARFFKSLADS